MIGKKLIKRYYYKQSVMKLVQYYCIDNGETLYLIHSQGEITVF